MHRVRRMCLRPEIIQTELSDVFHCQAKKKVAIMVVGKDKQNHNVYITQINGWFLQAAGCSHWQNFPRKFEIWFGETAPLKMNKPFKNEQIPKQIENYLIKSTQYNLNACSRGRVSWYSGSVCDGDDDAIPQK